MLTEQECAFLQEAFADPGPDMFLVDQTILANVALIVPAFPYTYYALGHCPPSFGHPLGNRLYVTSKMLSAAQLLAEQSLPIGSRELLAVLWPYYRQQFPGHEGVYALLHPGSRKERGVLLFSSLAMPGRIQYTYFDQCGLNSHVTLATEEAALLKALGEGYKNPRPDLVDHMALFWQEKG